MRLPWSTLLGVVYANSTSSGRTYTKPGQSVAIPGWDMQVSSKVPAPLNDLSEPGYDSSSWHHVGSRNTVMGALVDEGIYHTNELFYSDNMRTTIDYAVYAERWLYRKEINLLPTQGNHYFLQTHGITSKASIWMNGKQIATSQDQAGAYGGHTYDVTGVIAEHNAIAVEAYNTDYQKDFAMSWVDWNPYPPDNGTGIWREIFLKETGPVSVGNPRIVSNFTDVSTTSVLVTVLEDEFQLLPGQSQTLSQQVPVQNPKIWWPKQWGDQPLYSVQATVYHDQSIVSDVSEERNFGIRHVESYVNKHNDTAFIVNGKPFLVLGGGYAPDIFMRWESAKFEEHAKNVLGMGLNTIRLEGKQEQPELYNIADRLGLMVISGWECCDEWEAWSYNEDIDGKVPWSAHDYTIANASMYHEAEMLQSHPSMLAFFVGSDYWPDDTAASIYVDALHSLDWPNPIICSAAKRGYPAILGPSGMKMDGPYDWVPPNYWYEDQLGAAFGFGSELGPGVGTPELSSMKRFLSRDDMESLWDERADQGKYHMSGNTSQFHNRSIYNTALRTRYGQPTGLDDYLLKAQMMDYEATRSQFEAYAAHVGHERPSTGNIYWMLNSAWPSLHWQLWDYYGAKAAAYYGVKTAGRMEHVAFDYKEEKVWVINRGLEATGTRRVGVEAIDTSGKSLATQKFDISSIGASSASSPGAVQGLNQTEVKLLRLTLKDENGMTLSRNVYWLGTGVDQLDWDNSTWYYTPVDSFANYQGLFHMGKAAVQANARSSQDGYLITLENTSDAPAVFLRLHLVDAQDDDVLPVLWEDNYVTLWPRERMELKVESGPHSRGEKVKISGLNIQPLEVAI